MHSLNICVFNSYRIVSYKLILTNTETGGKIVINFAIENLTKICNQMIVFFFISSRIK